VACRVARLSHREVGIGLVYCCRCGSAHLEMFHTSKTLGPHLCSSCVESAVECGAGEGQQDTIVEERPCAV
jgi:hypothetical protein